MPSHRRSRCRFYSACLNACLPVAKRPHKAMLLQHSGIMHPTEVRPYVEQMPTEDIATGAG
jgi:hypothetical protein